MHIIKYVGNGGENCFLDMPKGATWNWWWHHSDRALGRGVQLLTACEEGSAEMQGSVAAAVTFVDW